jgi:hypothetical protein
VWQRFLIEDLVRPTSAHVVLSERTDGLAALANVTAHEASEARSDPASPGAWYDAAGEENGDKCAWTFGAPLVAFSNGWQWKLQG